MKTTSLLLPHWCKKVGLFLFIPSTILLIAYWIGQLSNAYSMELSINDLRSLFGLQKINSDQILGELSGFCYDSDLLYTFVSIIFTISGIMIGFSRLKVDDEYLESIRYHALTLSIYINATFLILSMIFVWGLSFLYVMEFNLYFTLIFYLIYFHIKLAIARKELQNEE